MGYLPAGSYTVVVDVGSDLTIEEAAAGIVDLTSPSRYELIVEPRIPADSSLVGRNIVVGRDISIEGGVVGIGSKHPVQAFGNISLQTGSRLTSESYHSRLELEAPSGSITISQGSEIDMDARGEQGVSRSSVCHGGVTLLEEPYLSGEQCSYGYYSNPVFSAAASTGHETRNGGGFIALKADNISHLGLISSNGTEAAGGSVRLEANLISGNGNIEAKGLGGAGGRIALRGGDTTGFTGTLFAEAGGDRRVLPGAGTVFVGSESGDRGTLTVDAKNVPGPDYGTPVGSIGRHRIVSSDLVAPGRWRIGVETDIDNFTGAVPCVSGICSVQYHDFTLPESGFVIVGGELNHASETEDGLATEYLIFRDSGIDLTHSDLIPESVGNRFLGGLESSRYWLEAGDYTLAVGTRFGRSHSERPRLRSIPEMSVDAAISGAYQSDRFLAWDYQIYIKRAAIDNSTADGISNLTGRTVSLDAADENSTLYEIVGHSGGAIEVETDQDLSGVVDQTLLGVHKLENLNILNGASVSFGEDRLVLENLSGLDVDSMQLAVGELDERGVAHLQNTTGISGPRIRNPVAIDQLSLTAGESRVFESLSVDQDLALQNGSVLEVSGGLHVEGDVSLGGTSTRVHTGNLDAQNLFLDGAVLIAHRVAVRGDITLINGARIVPVPMLRLATDSKSYGDLVEGFGRPSISAIGSILVDGSSAIDASGQGFSFTLPGIGRSGCDTGFRSYFSEGLNCLPNNFLGEMTPGSGSAAASGGGTLRIEADNIDLAGAIRADGEGVDNPDREGDPMTGAGGELEIRARRLTGNGTISASGGVTNLATGAGGGGIVDILVSENYGFAGTVVTNPGSSALGVGAGVGVVTVTENGNEYPDVVATNGTSSDLNLDAGFARVGSYEIQDIEYLGENRWKVSRSLDGLVDVLVDESLEVTDEGAGSVGRFYFSVDKQSDVEFLINAPEMFEQIRLYRLDRSWNEVFFGEEIAVNVENTYLKKDLSLHPGEYRLAVGDQFFSYSEGLSGRVDRSGRRGGIVSVTVKTLPDASQIWSSPEVFPNGMLNGLHVDLDDSDSESPLFRIDRASEHALYITTPQDLLPYLGKKMVGVHIFNTLTTQSFMGLDFGKDKILLMEPENSTVFTSSPTSGGFIGTQPDVIFDLGI